MASESAYKPTSKCREDEHQKQEPRHSAQEQDWHPDHERCSWTNDSVRIDFAEDGGHFLAKPIEEHRQEKH